MASQDWFDWAISIEQQADCDIEAGPDIGRMLREYIYRCEGTVTRDKLVEFLKAELGNLLPLEEIEMVASRTIESVSDRIQARDSDAKSA